MADLEVYNAVPRSKSPAPIIGPSSCITAGGFVIDISTTIGRELLAELVISQGMANWRDRKQYQANNVLIRRCEL